MPKSSNPSPEAFVTLRTASKSLGIPYNRLFRAADAGLIPTYTICGSRRLVLLSEVVAAIRAHRVGGMQTPEERERELLEIIEQYQVEAMERSYADAEGER